MIFSAGGRAPWARTSGNLCQRSRCSRHASAVAAIRASGMSDLSGFIEVASSASVFVRVVPMRIRKKEGFSSSDRFIAVEVKDGVLFKKGRHTESQD